MTQALLVRFPEWDSVTRDKIIALYYSLMQTTESDFEHGLYAAEFCPERTALTEVHRLACNDERRCIRHVETLDDGMCDAFFKYGAGVRRERKLPSLPKIEGTESDSSSKAYPTLPPQPEVAPLRRPEPDISPVDIAIAVGVAAVLTLTTLLFVFRRRIAS